MKINSSNTDITSLLSAYAARQRSTQSTDTDTSQSTASQAVSSLLGRLSPPDKGASVMSLSASGQKVKDSIQRPEPPTEEMKAAMKQLRTDFQTIQSADVDSLSSDDAKDLLNQLVSDIGVLPGTTAASGSEDTAEVFDISSLSDLEIKEILQKIQDQLEKNPKPAGAPPPEMQGMMWGFDPSALLSDGTSENTGISSSDTAQRAQQLVDLLTESYDSSSESSSDYATELKASIAEMLEKQKSGMDDFASALYAELDSWSSTQ